MSFFGSIGSALKGAVHGLGHLAEQAAPVVGFIPGVGTLAGGAIGGLGALAAGDGLSGALKYGIQGATSGFGGGLAKGLGVAKGVSSVLGGGGGGGDASAIPDSAFGLGGDSGGSGGGVLGTLEGLAGHAGDFLMGNGGKNALGVAQGISSVLAQKKSNDYANQALNTVTGAYNAKAPLRAQGLQGLLNPQHADTSNVGAIAGKLNTTAPQAGTPINSDSLSAIAQQLQGLAIPQATGAIGSDSLGAIAQKLGTLTTPQRSAPQDLGSLQNLQSKLGAFSAPVPAALQQFSAPPKPAAAGVSALLKDPGNPYAPKAA